MPSPIRSPRSSTENNSPFFSRPVIAIVLASIVLAVAAVFMPVILLPTILTLGLAGMVYVAAHYFGWFSPTSASPTNTAKEMNSVNEALLADLLDKLPKVKTHANDHVVLEKIQESTSNRYRTLFDSSPTASKNSSVNEDDDNSIDWNSVSSVDPTETDAHSDFSSDVSDESVVSIHV